MQLCGSWLLRGADADLVAASEKIGVGRAQPLGEVRPRAPAERRETRDVEELARRPVRLSRVIDETALVTYGRGDLARELGDRHVLAGADVEKTVGGVVLQHEHTGIGEVVHVEELALGRARAPDCDLARARELRLMHAPDQRR